MNEDKKDLLLVRKTDFQDLLRSVDLLAHRFRTLLTQLEQRQHDRILHPTPFQITDSASMRTDTIGSKLCRHCGRDLDVSARFCDVCGAPLTET